MISPAGFSAPDSLTELDQWVCWRSEPRPGEKKPAKVPYSVGSERASVSESSDWAPFDECVELWQKFPRLYAGVGFVFCAGGGIVGVDLDQCLDASGGLKPWAMGIVERFSDTFIDISPSNQGLKFWCRGSLARNLPGIKVAGGDGQIEMYSSGRFFTVTGRPFRGAPLEIANHASDVDFLYKTYAPVVKQSLRVVPGGRIKFGTQHNVLVSICGTLRSRGICDEAIEACLQAVNRHQCEKPASPEHVSRIVRSTRNWGGAK